MANQNGGDARAFQEALEYGVGEGLKILLWESGGESLKQVLRKARPKRIYAMIGPEGGFTQKEVTLEEIAEKMGGVSGPFAEDFKGHQEAYFT
jgi:16S rRNA U1498 N3-methylase RsmE